MTFEHSFAYNITLGRAATLAEENKAAEPFVSYKKQATDIAKLFMIVKSCYKRAHKVYINSDWFIGGWPQPLQHMPSSVSTSSLCDDAFLLAKTLNRHCRGQQIDPYLLQRKAEEVEAISLLFREYIFPRDETLFHLIPSILADIFPNKSFPAANPQTGFNALLKSLEAAQYCAASITKLGLEKAAYYQKPILPSSLTP